MSFHFDPLSNKLELDFKSLIRVGQLKKDHKTWTKAVKEALFQQGEPVAEQIQQTNKHSTFIKEIQG